MISAEEVGKKMDALDVWQAALPCHWAVKPRGSAFPYFCCTAKGDIPPVKVRFLMLDGWQTFHDYMRWSLDSDFGFYQTPLEIPHFELIILTNGEMRVLRDDPGYVPRDVTAHELELCTKVMWESYGILLRLETDPQLPLKFAAEQAMFARMEDARGGWHDEPLAIPPPRPHVEQVAFSKKQLAKAQDLPIRKDEILELDFRFVHGIWTAESPRPRLLYVLAAVDANAGELVFRDKLAIEPEGGLRQLWESVPPRVLAHFIEHRSVPGEVRTVSGRVFRIMRPLCVDLPFKLSRVSSLPHFSTALKNLI